MEQFFGPDNLMFRPRDKAAIIQRIDLARNHLSPFFCVLQRSTTTRGPVRLEFYGFFFSAYLLCRKM